jgi:hypothetical protein
MHDTIESMCNHEHGAFFERVIETSAYELIGIRVETCRRFVEQQYANVAKYTS